MHKILVIRLYFPLDAVIKSNHKNFVHLVGLYTYCKTMHGAYNVKLNNLHIWLYIFLYLSVM